MNHSRKKPTKIPTQTLFSYFLSSFLFFGIKGNKYKHKRLIGLIFGLRGVLVCRRLVKITGPGKKNSKEET